MTDYSKLFDMTAYSKTVNLEAVAEANKKTLDALKKANSVMAESLGALASRQVELGQAALESSIESARDLATAKGVEDYIAKQAGLFQATLEKSVENAKELATIATKAQSEAADIVTKQLLENVSVFAETATKAGKTAAATVVKK